jgi:hypothetical protein
MSFDVAVSIAGPNDAGVALVSRTEYAVVEKDEGLYEGPGSILDWTEGSSVEWPLASIRQNPVRRPDQASREADRFHMAATEAALPTDDTGFAFDVERTAAQPHGKWYATSIARHRNLLVGTTYLPQSQGDPAATAVFWASLARAGIVHVRRVERRLTSAILSQFEVDGRVLFVGNSDDPVLAGFSGIPHDAAEPPEPLALHRPAGSLQIRGAAFDGRLVWIASEGALWALDTDMGTGPDSWPIVFVEGGSFWDVDAKDGVAAAISDPIVGGGGQCKIHRYAVRGALVSPALVVSHPATDARCLGLGTDGRIFSPTAGGNVLRAYRSDLSIDYEMALDAGAVFVTPRTVGTASFHRMLVAIA